MVESANIARLKEMLTLLCPNPAGTIDIAGDKLKKIMINMGFEYLVITDANINEIREALDAGGRGFVPLDQFANYLDDHVANCTSD